MSYPPVPPPDQPWQKPQPQPPYAPPPAPSMPPTTPMPPVPPQAWPPQPMSGPPGYPPASAPPDYPPSGYPPAGYPVPPAPRSNNMLIVGVIVGVVVVLIVGGVVGLAAWNRRAADTSAPPVTTSTPSPDGAITDPPASDPPTTGADSETYNMQIGDGVRVTDDANQWTVQVLDAHWFPQSCGEFASGADPVLVLDVEFEVEQGTASLNTLFEFTFIADDGQEATSTGFTFCADPALNDTFDLPAGEIRDGQVDFEVPSGTGGTLKYQGLFDTDPIATWVIPGP